MHLACLRLQTGQAQTENRLGLVSVEPNVRFCTLAQIPGIRAVVGYRVMIIVPAMIGSGPPDDGHVVQGQLKYGESPVNRCIVALSAFRARK